MTPEKACPAHGNQNSVCELCAFDKKLGRLKRVEEMMRENARDTKAHKSWDEDALLVGVFYPSDEWATMLEELQSVIAEIEREMKG